MPTVVAFIVTAVVCLAIGVWFGWQVLPRDYFVPFALAGVLVWPCAALAVSVTVDRVLAGDVIVTTEGRRIELHGIATPELAQPHGGDAFLRLHSYVNDRSVELRNVQPATWGRESAVVVVDGNDVAIWLLRRGLAWVDEREVGAEHAAAYRLAYEVGKAAKRGQWADITPPWVTRDQAVVDGRSSPVASSERSSWRQATVHAEVNATQTPMVIDSPRRFALPPVVFSHASAPYMCDS